MRLKDEIPASPLSSVCVQRLNKFHNHPSLLSTLFRSLTRHFIVILATHLPPLTAILHYNATFVCHNYFFFSFFKLLCEVHNQNLGGPLTASKETKYNKLKNFLVFLIPMNIISRKIVLNIYIKKQDLFVIIYFF